MCTFLKELPTKSKTATYGEDVKFKKRNNFMMRFRPTKDKEVYRFRLLAFTNQGCDRDFPFIEKNVHEYWEDDENGNGRLKDFTTCPASPYVAAGKNSYDCPICKYGWSHFRKWKESGKTDAISKKKWQSAMNKYIAIIPVYVVKDPNYPDNNGTLKAIVLKDREMYKDILALIKQAQKSDCVFNGENAVDFYTTVAKKEIVYREGQPSEYRFFRTQLDKMGFSTKPYDIPTITKELIDAFPFDDEYYTYTTEEESREFLETYIFQPDIAVPDDDLDLDSSDTLDVKASVKTEAKQKPKPEVTNIANAASKKLEEAIADDVNDIDIDDIVDEVTASPQIKSKDVEAAKEVEDDQDTIDDIDEFDLDNLDALLDDM